MISVRARKGRNLVRLGVVPAVLVTGALLVLIGSQAVQSFWPPRTAVVDISVVFENYDKVKDRQKQLNDQLEDVRGRLREFKTKYEELKSDLEKLEKGSDLYSEKRLEMGKIELEVEALQETEGKQLKESMRDFLKTIRQEITTEIESFAKAKELDLVLEKTVSMEGNGGAIGFRWPIVHFARPEIDVTKEVTTRLNEKYRRP